jgi:hypothetical protein
VNDDASSPAEELAQRWALYEARKAAWLAANPGAYPCEIEHAFAYIAWELGL